MLTVLAEILGVKGLAATKRPDSSCRVPAKPEVTVN